MRSRAAPRRCAAARADALPRSPGLAKGGPQRREPLYLLAVACFRSGHVADAKRWAATALAVAPTCHQSEALRQACDEQLAEDALLAAGVAGVAGVGLALLAGVLMAGARRRPS